MSQALPSLSELSNALADLVERTGSAVVRVEGRNRMPATGVVYSADGVIVTAHHVVERDDNLAIGLPNGESVPAQLVGRDPSTDLAVLRVTGGQLERCRMGRRRRTAGRQPGLGAWPARAQRAGRARPRDRPGRRIPHTGGRRDGPLPAGRHRHVSWLLGRPACRRRWPGGGHQLLGPGTRRQPHHPRRPPSSVSWIRFCSTGTCRAATWASASSRCAWIRRCMHSWISRRA